MQSNAQVIKTFNDCIALSHTLVIEKTHKSIDIHTITHPDHNLCQTVSLPKTDDPANDELHKTSFYFMPPFCRSHHSQFFPPVFVLISGNFTTYQRTSKKKKFIFVSFIFCPHRLGNTYMS